MLLQVLFFYLGVPVLYQMITGTRLQVDPMWWDSLPCP